MKRKMLSISILLLVFGIMAEALPDLKSYRKPGKKPVLALQETFNDGLKPARKRGWQFPKTAQWDAHGGITGSGALLLERKNLKDLESGVAKIPLKLKNGWRYVLILSYKTENVPAGWASALPAIDQIGQDGKKRRVFPSLRHQKNGKWHNVEYEFLAKKKNILICQLFRAKTGKIWYDDVKVEPSQKNAEFYLTRPFKLTLGADNSVEYRAYPDGVKPEDMRNYLVYVELAGQKAAAPLDKTGRAIVKFKNISKGKYPVKAMLLNNKTKQIVAEDQTVLFKREATGTGLDAAGRMIIDGKPVLAIGIYITWVEKECEIKKIADAGFTFVLDYTSAYLNITQGKERDPVVRAKETNQEHLAGHFKYKYNTPQGRVQIKKSLDIINKYRLKYIQGYSTGLGMTPEYNHPVVIGKYYADEHPVTEVQRFRKIREKTAEISPSHLTLGLTDKSLDCIPYAKAFDIFGYDVYPIRGKGAHSMKRVRDYTIAQLKTGIPGMFVPQAFCWSGYGGKKNDPLPTTEELRSMVLLPAIYGIRIYCFYSYTALLIRNRGIGIKGTQEFWDGAIIDSVKCLRSLEPWLLSNEKAPEVKISNKEKSVIDAKTFSFKGKVKVIITACGPGKAQAEIIIPGKNDLKSRYGHTKNLGGGKYLFTGQDIASDILDE